MVICQYFLSNSCRFGSKCNNDHIDVRGTIKAEMDAAIKGKQWPLSCFGPFKEKRNLIPDESDLSFEEVRLQCFESKANNTFPMYEQQLMQRIQEANMRMHTLMNVNREVLQSVINIYDEKPSTTDNKPFGSTTSTATGIFGGGTSSTFQQSASIFGGSTSGGFGQTTTPASSGFNQPAGAGIFGGGTTNQTTMQNTASIFGGGTTGGQTQATGSIFGQSTATNATSGAGIFTGGTTSLPFGQTSSIFGANKTGFTSLQTGAGIFGGATNTPTTGFNQPQTGIFRGGATTGTFTGSIQPADAPFGQQPAQSLIFSAPPPSFGATPQQNPTFRAAQPTNYPFGATQQPAGPFGAAATSSNVPTGLFSAANSNLQQQQPPPNPFGQAAPTPISVGNQSSVFGNLGQNAVQAAQQAAIGGIFTNQSAQQSQPPPAFGQSSFGGTSTGFGVTNTPQPATSSGESFLYSKMEDLTSEQLAAFQADEFVMGQIPNVPPPRELCI